MGMLLRTIGRVISIGRISAGDAAAYYLEKQAGCDLDYYTGDGEARGRWLGDGARELGLVGRLGDADEQALRALLSGCGLAGERLVAPVLRADPRGLLPAAPLVRALQAVGTAPRSGADLLGVGRLADHLDTAATAVAQGSDPLLAADVIGQIAAQAGLDAVALYRNVDGTDTYNRALPYAGAKVDIRRPGLDVTVSAPKSVSILYGLADPAVSQVVRRAHDTAVTEVVDYLQRHAATGARGHQGGGKRAPRIATAGLIVAAFDHRTSRAGDPQLHTHLVIPNVVRGADGRWSAMDTAAVYRHARTASSLYHAVLRGELTRQLGVEWTPVRRGVAEVHGIPRTVLDAFSKRRAQVIDAVTRRGVSGPKAAQAACLATRPAKVRALPQELRARWRAEAAGLGIESDDVHRVLRATPAPAAPTAERLAAQLFAPAGLTAERTSFTRQDLARGICETLPAGTPVRLTDIDRFVEQLIAHPEVLPLVGSGRGERRYSTRELVETEQRALRLATAAPGAPVGVTNMRHVRSLAARSGLSAEQQAIVTALVTAGRRVDVVAGPAGSGKTAALELAHRIWTRDGLRVRGAAVSWLATQQLEAATGIRSASLASTLRNADQYGLEPGVVLVVDEASLVNTRTMARLLEHVHAAHGKLVLVGDPHQLPEIGAGGVFGALTERDTTIRLTGNQRQTAEWEREALRQFRGGDTVGALDAYVRHGRVHTEPTHPDVHDRIAADYHDARHRGDDVLVLAARRRDVAVLNRAIRDHLIDQDVLGADQLVITVADTPVGFRRGEQVLVTANDRRVGLVNGSRATLTDVNPGAGRVQLQFTDGRHLTLDREHLSAGVLTHGYAVTVHKAQGLTVDTTLVYGTGPLTHEHGYVALSRGRRDNHIYLGPAEEPGPECGPWPRDDASARSLTGELLERLAERGKHQLASRELADGVTERRNAHLLANRFVHDYDARRLSR